MTLWQKLVFGSILVGELALACVFLPETDTRDQVLGAVMIVYILVAGSALWQSHRNSVL